LKNPAPASLKKDGKKTPSIPEYFFVEKLAHRIAKKDFGSNGLSYSLRFFWWCGKHKQTPLFFKKFLVPGDKKRSTGALRSVAISQYFKLPFANSDS
jgi:hypothetical protein